jgi:hypothetical protein
MQAVTTIGLDIAKSVFQVHGVDAAGQVLGVRPSRNSPDGFPSTGTRSASASPPQNPRSVPTPHAQFVAPEQGGLSRRSSEAISSSPPQ